MSTWTENDPNGCGMNESRKNEYRDGGLGRGETTEGIVKLLGQFCPYLETNRFKNCPPCIYSRPGRWPSGLDS